MYEVVQYFFHPKYAETWYISQYEAALKSDRNLMKHQTYFHAVTLQ